MATLKLKPKTDKADKADAAPAERRARAPVRAATAPRRQRTLAEAQAERAERERAFAERSPYGGRSDERGNRAGRDDERRPRGRDDERPARGGWAGRDERPPRDAQRPDRPRREGAPADRPRTDRPARAGGAPGRPGDRPDRTERPRRDAAPGERPRRRDEGGDERPRRREDAGNDRPRRREDIGSDRPRRAAGPGSDRPFGDRPPRGAGPRDERPPRRGDDPRDAPRRGPGRPDERRGAAGPRGDDRPARGPRRDGDAPRRPLPPATTQPPVDAPPRPAAAPVDPSPRATLGDRLSKRLTAMGVASRREADDWIEAGWVKVDGHLAVLGERVGPDAKIEIDPAARHQQAQRMTVLLHKPIGYVSGQAEDGYEPAVVLVKPGNRWAEDNSGVAYHPGHLRSLVPAGRLDIDSTGLLVLTQDGRVAKQLIGEDSTIEKEYLVRVEYAGAEPGARLPDTDLERLRHGLWLDGVKLQPAKVSWQNEDQLRFVLREGRKRQIRRMCEAVGLKVVGLKRVRIGSVVLGHLPPGQWRYLRKDERF